MNKPYCIMLPGWGMESGVWSAFCGPLCAAAELTYMDWRGVEAPGKVGASVLERMMSAPEQSLTLMGWSLGAMAAIDAAAACPDRVERLILFGATSRFVAGEDGKSEPPGWDARVLRRMKRRLELEKEAALADFYKMMFSSAEREAGWAERFLQDVHSRFQGDSTASLLHGLDYLLQSDLRGVLPHINVPMLLIHGEEDAVCPPAASAYIAEHTGGDAQVVMMPGVGHAPFVTKPNECLTAVMEFMQER